jgi:hypothetical protein
VCTPNIFKSVYISINYRFNKEILMCQNQDKNWWNAEIFGSWKNMTAEFLDMGRGPADRIGLIGHNGS